MVNPPRLASGVRQGDLPLASGDSLFRLVTRYVGRQDRFKNQGVNGEQQTGTGQICRQLQPFFMMTQPSRLGTRLVHD